ncbi:MAG: glycoside hydrolase family 2 protein [Clostridia bacterium]|nr:glycoside hydrolase family 2 protein [Clostridia bacterium]
MREILNLNYGWRFSADFRPEYTLVDFKDSVFKLVDIPHIISDAAENYVSEKQYQKVTCYRKMFILPDSMKRRRLILHFDGVMGCVAAFVNGRPVCAHKGGFTSFSCDVTNEVITYNKENLITVVVDSTEREDTAPFGDYGDQLYYGGIYREVWLEAVDEIRIEEHYLRTTRDEDGWLITLNGRLSTDKGAEIRYYLYDGDKKLSVKYFNCEGSTYSGKWDIPDKIRPWSIDSPNLYKIVANIEGKDEISFDIGFREAEFRADGFYLNGEKLKLVGLSRNQNYSRLGNALPAYAQECDARLLKELGCNIVRTDHCPPSQHFLDACDRLGLLVFEELPGKKYIGNADWRDCLLTNMREMMVRDRNHPSIVLWGVRIDDSGDCDELYDATSALAKELDGARSVTAIRSSLPEAIAEDVYAVNDYSHTGENAGLERKKNLLKAKQPFLVTGHTGYRYPARSYDTEAIRTEHALRHARVLDAAYGEIESCGVIGCSFADTNTHSNRGGADNMCAYGVTDSARTKKLAAYVYESQVDDHVVMELSSSLSGGEYPNGELGLVYVFTNCDSVRLSRDGVTVGEFFPDKKSFPNLPHPPVLIDDFIGDAPRQAGFTDDKEIAAIRNALTIMSRDGEYPSPSRLKAAMVATRYKLTSEQLTELYDKLCGGKFDGARFVFEGIMNGEVVRSIVCEPVYETGMRIDCDKTELTNGDTYDCTRIELTAVDQNGNRLYNCFDAVSVDCDGSIEIIGTKLFSLIGGATSFYVRSKGGKGAAKVRITTQSLGNYEVELKVNRPPITKN